MRITIDDNAMVAVAIDYAEDGRQITASFDVFADDTVDDLISRSTDELSEVYLDMLSPYM